MGNISENELIKELLMHGVSYNIIAKTMHLHTSRISPVKKEMVEAGWDPKEIIQYDSEEEKERRLAEIEDGILQKLSRRYTHRGMRRSEFVVLQEKRKAEAKILLEQGEPLTGIAEKMGISLSTVKKYLQDVNVQYADPTKGRAALPSGYEKYFREEWIKAVNRIRRYYGMEEFKEG